MNRYQAALDEIKYVSDSMDGFCVYEIYEKEVGLLQELIDLHNKPLKLEEIKPNMWVFDNKTKGCINTGDVEMVGNKLHMCVYKEYLGSELYDWYYIVFEENRYYRYQPLETSDKE